MKRTYCIGFYLLVFTPLSALLAITQARSRILKMVETSDDEHLFDLLYRYFHKPTRTHTRIHAQNLKHTRARAHVHTHTHTHTHVSLSFIELSSTWWPTLTFVAFPPYSLGRFGWRGRRCRGRSKGVFQGQPRGLI